MWKLPRRPCNKLLESQYVCLLQRTYTHIKPLSDTWKSTLYFCNQLNQPYLPPPATIQNDCWPLQIDNCQDTTIVSCNNPLQNSTCAPLVPAETDELPLAINWCTANLVASCNQLWCYQLRCTPQQTHKNQTLCCPHNKLMYCQVVTLQDKCMNHQSCQPMQENSCITNSVASCKKLLNNLLCDLCNKLYAATLLPSATKHLQPNPLPPCCN